jgi:hypothetical protein
MAYTPNPDREVVNGKAKVSAKELADFQKQYGNDKTLRDLLNMDKGLVRRKDPEDIQSSTDAKPSMSRQSGPPTTTQGATYPKPSIEEGGVKSKSRSSWDSTFGEDAEAGFKKAARGDSPLNDAIMGAGKLAIAAVPVGRALSAVRPVVGAVLKKEFSEDGLFPTFNRKKDPSYSTFDTLSPENQAVSRQYRSTYDDRPGPMKKGGAVKQYAKGGRISLDACGVSTHKPAKKNPNF